MAYRYAIKYSRPTTDDNWYVMDTDVVLNEAETARETVLNDWIDSKKTDGDIAVSWEFSEDMLDFTYILTYADEAAYDTLQAEWAVIRDAQCDGIEPETEAKFVQFNTDTGSTYSVTKETV
tara:strand:- start:8723 stop:9085 length:363 start_codon:yes stop_codon:yes gene_type:complete